MIIGGLQKVSLIDYPGKISAVVFTQGCNFNCFYCHNKLLLDRNVPARVTEETFFDFLEKRKEKLDAVVISGGEPTIQPDLILFIKKIKRLGYLVKLDTNGSNPDILERIIIENLVDYIAMDIKTSYLDYERVTQMRFVDTEKISKSINLIKNSKIEYEFRTTLATGVEENLRKIKEMLDVDISKHKLQNQRGLTKEKLDEILVFVETYYRLFEYFEKQIANKMEGSDKPMMAINYVMELYWEVERLKRIANKMKNSLSWHGVEIKEEI
jgi:pyruvate formate lyase activating enzyme